MQLTELKSGGHIERLALLVKSASVQKAKSGKDFLSLVLTDGDSETQAKVWSWDSPASDTPKTGAVIVLAGRVEEYQGLTQIIISRFESASGDEADPARYLPRAPRAIEDMVADIRRAVKEIKDDGIRKIVIKLVDDGMKKAALAAAPASQKLHHAEVGGLLHHITDMLAVARALCGVYASLNPDLLLAGVIIHDLGKLQELSFAGAGLAEDYTLEGRLAGHLVIGARAVRAAAAECGAPEETALLLEHLVLAHHGVREFGSPVLPQIPEAIALNAIDLLDAKMFQCDAALKNVKPGGFTEKLWHLENRQLYKARGAEARDGGADGFAGGFADARTEAGS